MISPSKLLTTSSSVLSKKICIRYNQWRSKGGGGGRAAKSGLDKKILEGQNI